MTRAFPDLSGKRKDLVLLQQIASYILLACGLIYIISVSSSYGLTTDSQWFMPPNIAGWCNLC